MFATAASVILLSLIVFSTSSEHCTISQYSDVASVISICKDIIVSNVTVPAGETLKLNLTKGSIVTIKGNVSFGFQAWKGPLLEITGEGITVQGQPGSVIDGQGALYWDHLGDKGLMKPQLVNVMATGGSIIRNLKFLNCPHHCFAIRNSDILTLTGITIDVADGDRHNFTGHNTDGFNILNSRNIIMENSRVTNQDDCVAINSGANILIRNFHCDGGHGLSLSVNFAPVSNVTFSDSIVRRSANGIHLKTHTDGGETFIKNITYKNIELEGITNFGINIQQDYKAGEGTGIPASNIPIIDLVLTNITGTMHGKDSKRVQIICGDTGCFDWHWSVISITGNSTSSDCNYSPYGFTC
ncbi:hypothetical protein JTB14_009445 [Gonioctena quinquepunctata]|nr:hypothetical protein JTB14_009445 [Gonioctena quinquepunctata]